MKTVAIIPARYASTRFPGKPLANIGGKPMIVRVWEQTCACTRIDAVYVTTDDDRIEAVLKDVGAQVIRTAAELPSGTHRCFDAYAQLTQHGISADILLNIQGDEPFVAPEQLAELIELMHQPHVSIGTLVSRIVERDVAKSEHVVKVVLSHQFRALYFSRSLIPFTQTAAASYWKHVGLYGFKTAVIGELQQLPESGLEQAERLEQLRWLEHDFSIYAAPTQYPTWAVDTPEDLTKLPVKPN